MESLHEKHFSYFTFWACEKADLQEEGEGVEKKLKKTLVKNFTIWKILSGSISREAARSQIRFLFSRLGIRSYGELFSLS
jgi:hypothetical protein